MQGSNMEDAESSYDNEAVGEPGDADGHRHDDRGTEAIGEADVRQIDVVGGEDNVDQDAVGGSDRRDVDVIGGEDGLGQDTVGGADTRDLDAVGGVDDDEDDEDDENDVDPKREEI
jgi:hypothetical protein